MNRPAQDMVTIRHARKRLLILSLLALALTLLPGSAAQSEQRCFPETGFCIAGPIRAYWLMGLIGAGLWIGSFQEHPRP
jgi:hypothetical protein